MTALRLQLQADRQALSTLEALKLKVRLENAGAAAVSAPSSQDMSGALQILTFRGPDVVRVASGVTHQELMIRGRVDTTPDLDELEPGAAWERELDLGSYQYPPEPGQYVLQARMTLPSEEVIASNPLAVSVVPAWVHSVQALRDNPVIDGTALLIQPAQQAAASAILIRQYNTAKPQAYWYGDWAPLAPGARAVLARPSYFQTSSFDHFFERWLLTQEAESLTLQPLSFGQMREPAQTAQLPRGWRLIAAADHGHRKVDVIACASDGQLACFTWEAAGLKPLWGINLGVEAVRTLEPQVICDAAHYHVFFVGDGVYHARVERVHGVAEAARQRFGSDLLPASLSVDPVARRVHAAFWDGVSGVHLQLVSCGFDDEPGPRVFYQQRPPALQQLYELGFDQDPNGVFHVLLNCAAGLFYQQQGREPEWLLPGGVARCPLVIAQPAVHLGFFDAQLGYGLYPYRRGLILPSPPQPSMQRPGGDAGLPSANSP